MIDSTLSSIDITLNDSMFNKLINSMIYREAYYCGVFFANKRIVMWEQLKGVKEKSMSKYFTLGVTSPAYIYFPREKEAFARIQGK